MASWLSRLGLALLLAVAAHMLVLWMLGQQLQAIGSVIAPQVDPLFTRQITQQGSAEPKPSAASEEKRVPPQSNTSVSATKNIVNADLKPKAASSEPLGNTPTVPLASVPELAITSTAAPSATASSASQPTVTVRMADSASADASAALASQGQWPSDTRLSYQLGGYFRGELHGNAQVQWTRPMATGSASVSAATQALPSDRYQVRIDIQVALAKVQMVSQGRVSTLGLQPEAYEELLPSGARRSVSLTAQEVKLMDGRLLPKPPNTLEAVQDTASQFVDLGHRFTTGQARLVQGEVVRVWLARPAGLDEWIYDVGPAETIYLPTLGAVQAYHLNPRPLAKARGTIVAQIWIAPSLQNLPVRIKITLNSETHVDLLVNKIEQR
jgi:hypothetical protein